MTASKNFGFMAATTLCSVNVCSFVACSRSQIMISALKPRYVCWPEARNRPHFERARQVTCCTTKPQQVTFGHRQHKGIDGMSEKEFNFQCACPVSVALQKFLWPFAAYISDTYCAAERKDVRFSVRVEDKTFRYCAVETSYAAQIKLRRHQNA